MDLVGHSHILLGSAVHTLSNKVVLSVEGFVYPAVFLSWQALWAAVSLARVVLRARRSPRCTNQLLRGILFILPLVSLHTYAGSKALAELPVPIFLALQSAVQLFLWGIDAVQRPDEKGNQRCLSQLSIFIMAIFSVSSILIRMPASLSNGASWMTLHVLSLAIVKFLEANVVNQCVKSSFHLKELTYHCSVLILLTSTSLLAGDYFHVFQAPHFNRTTFWFSFIASGATIAFMAPHRINLFMAIVIRVFTAVLALILFGLPEDIPIEINVWTFLLFLCLLKLNWGPPPPRPCCNHDLLGTLTRRQNHSDCDFQAII